jgi:hypothetical protein
MIGGIVFPASSTVSLEILTSLNYIKNINIIGVNSTSNYEYKYLFEKTFDECPYIDKNENDCINYLIKICLENNCNFIIPTMDYSHLILSKYENIFKNNKIKIISSSYETNKICISKKNTYLTLKNIISCPFIYNKIDIKDSLFPVFLKPDIGYGSKNCHIIKNIDEFSKIYNDESMLILEYLTGDEYTVDCFTTDKLLYFQIRKRVLYKNGLSIITETENIDSLLFKNIEEYANKINDNIHFKGAWFFQIKLNKDNKFKLLEISTRIAGASSINHLNGCNLILLSIFYHFNYPININKNKHCFTVYKYLTNYINFNTLDIYENIYIDLDDTLIIKEKINEKMIYFIYKCINKNKNIYLISRHKSDILLTLKEKKINIDIFTEIIHIENITSLKSTYIKENSIFIDDSFSERLDVSSKIKNILVVDVNFINFF